MASAWLRAGLVGLALVGAAASLPACGGTVGQARHSDTGVLKIQCSVDDAELWVDSKYIRSIGTLRGGIRLDAGSHRIELRHERYHSRYFEVEIEAGEVRRLEVEMARRFP